MRRAIETIAVYLVAVAFGVLFWWGVFCIIAHQGSLHGHGYSISAGQER